MNSFENNRRHRPHLVIPENASEPQAFISWGEDILARVQQVAHEIEEDVRRVLDDSPYTLSPSFANRTDHNSSNRHAEDEPGGTEGAVDNRKRRW